MSALISSAVARHVAGELRIAADLGELGRAVERDPAHQLGGHVVLRLAPRLPDALVRALARPAWRIRPGPGRSATVDAGGGRCAGCAGGSSRAPRRTRRSAAGRTRRCRSAPAARRRSPERWSQRRLGQVAAAVDPVHDLERAVLVGLEVGDELHELVGLPVEVEEVQRLERERRVAHPAVAVVPVALAAGGLGQRRRERGHRRTGGHVGEALDRERRALDRDRASDGRGAAPGRASARQ